jgi:CRP-like cAMP-binding protein
VSYRGDEVVVNIFKPGAFFPMSWAINNTGNRFFYKTEEETELHLVPVEDALAFLKSNPDVMLDLLSRLYRGMEGVLGRMVQLMSGTAQSRLAYELIIECRRFGEQGQPSNYKLNISETDLAARTGLTRETVSREMQKLKEKGMIDLHSKTLVVNDLETLEQLLGSTA